MQADLIRFPTRPRGSWLERADIAESCPSTRAPTLLKKPLTAPPSSQLAPAQYVREVPGPATATKSGRVLRVLAFTTLFPNEAQPQHGIFVENRLRHLIASGRVQAQVVAPVPWFPFRSKSFGSYAVYGRVPASEERYGVAVHHPRYPLVPKVGMSAAPLLLYQSSKRALRRLVVDGSRFDLIDAHYFYPDGVAAVMLARHLRLPVCVTARGTDLNLIPQYTAPRRWIVWAARNATGLVTVCEALKRQFVELGVAPERIRVLRNGVDLHLFRPVDRQAARAKLGLNGPILLSVGGLIPLKGHHLAIEALGLLPGVRLLIAGEGPMRGELAKLAARLGLAGRVDFLGAVAHESLPAIYTAADALVLASSREGWANVLLEAMACGTPVVASNVGGNAEVVAANAAGILMSRRTPTALADAVRRLLLSPPTREATRAYAEGFSWEATTNGQIELFEEMLANRGGRE